VPPARFHIITHCTEEMTTKIRKPSLRTRGLRAAAALLLVAAWGCESARVTAPEAAVKSDGRVVSPEFDIHEATLRYMFASHGATGMDAYCVSTGHPDATNDPGSLLLDRFAGSSPQVVAYSSCTITVGGDTYDPTGGPAQWFFLGSAAISGRRATVSTGFHVNGRLAEWYDCNLRQTGTGWSVSGCTLTATA
jgi:hypothetical protein